MSTVSLFLASYLCQQGQEVVAMGVLVVVVVLLVVGIVGAWWWIGRARAVEHKAQSASQRAEIDARIMKQYRPSPPTGPTGMG
jgi:flagellar basal body-associated protein FliL